MESIQKRLNIYKDRKKILVDNMIGGVGWAFGATIGFSILLAIVGLILSHLNVIPFIGGFVAELSKYVDKAGK